jgi:Zn-dependent M28 family amino/carboxypeptidase
MKVVFPFFKLFIFATIALLACNRKISLPKTAFNAASLNADSLRGHVAVLASDSFLGRKPFTEGETKTIQYLQQTFAALGLQPGNGNSYLQEVPMVNIVSTPEPTMHVQSKNGRFTIKNYDDYVIWANKTEGNVNLDNTELVFVGYGVVAPEYNWNDYAGLDVKGKIVLVMVNDPGFWVGDTTLFKGKAMTYYGRWTYKFEEAARHGARGCLIIHNTRAAGYPFSVVQNSFSTARLQLDNRQKKIKTCEMQGWLQESAAKQIFAAAGFDSSLFRIANDRAFKPISLGVTVSTNVKAQYAYKKSYNVIAKVNGSKRPEEVILYSAHWDHLGVGKPDARGDSIYNGAVDNATGTAGLLELARAFQNLKPRPERTLLFLAVTAEEQGLLGSEYYTTNPIYAAAKTVANINMDGLNPFTATKDVVVVGRGQSELEDYIAEEAEKEGRYITAESNPEAGIYYRSDHFNFAKVGIPAVFLNTGVDVVGKGKSFGQQLKDQYASKGYHQPSDEFISSTWTMDGAISDLQLLFQVGKRLAFEKKWPKWKVGSEFKLLRSK